MKKVLLAAVLILSISACHHKQEKVTTEFESSGSGAGNGVSADANMVLKEENEPSLNFSPPEVKEDEFRPQIIKTGDIRFEVEDLKTSTATVSALVSKYKAYVSTSSTTNQKTSFETKLSIRIPSQSFDRFLDELSNGAKYIDHKNISTEDVTEEYVDIEARLKNKKEVEKRYIEILRNNAKKVEDIIKVEEQLRVIREEIEAKEGRMRYLKSQVSYSTLEVEMYQLTGYVASTPERGFIYKLIDSLKEGWMSVVNIILGLFSIWPWLIVFGAIAFVVRRRIFKKG